MTGTPQGGRHAAATNKARYGENYYRNIGQLGGRNSRNCGFAKNREMAREAGRKGGLNSHRTPGNHLYQLWIDGVKLFDGTLKEAIAFSGYSKSALFNAARDGRPIGPYTPIRYSKPKLH